MGRWTLSWRSPLLSLWRYKLLFLLGGVIALMIAVMTLLLPQSPLMSLGWPGWLTLGVTLVAFTLNAGTTLPAEIVFLGSVAILLITGVLDTNDALAGFSNDGVVTIGVLYIVVTGLQQTGALALISQRVLGLPQSERAALWRLMLPIIGLSAFLNNTPVVAMFIPVVNDWCRKLSLSPSKLMIPLSFAAIFGGTCTLIGTSTNLVVNGLLIAETDYPGLSFWAITGVGLPCAIAGTIFILLFHQQVLPARKPVVTDTDDARQYTVEMVVSSASPLAGKTIEQAGLRHLPGLYLMEIKRGDQLIPAVGPREILREQDQLVFVGMVDSVVDLQRFRGLQPATDQVFKLDTPRSERSLVEAVVSNTCSLVRRTIRESQFRTRYNAVVLAVARNGERLSSKIGDIRLQPGDTLLLEAGASFLEQQRSSRDFYLVSSIPDSEPLRHEKASLALLILAVMVILATMGWLSMLKASVLAAVAMVITGCCSTNRALSSIEWPVLLVVGAALGLGKALEVTGTAGAIAATFVTLAGDSPWLALIVVYGITTILTEVITNNAAAALMFPIALALANSLDVDFIPFVIAIMLAASASFATPIGYQTNLMVYGPGGYKFTDFTRIGVPLNLLFWVITATLTPILFPF